MSEEIIVENVPRLVKDSKSQIQETQRAPSWRREKSPGRFRDKELNTRDTDKILQVARGKRNLMLSFPVEQPWGPVSWGTFLSLSAPCMSSSARGRGLWPI